ncbi:MAG: hypothetical protein GX418_14800 [Clostridiales bacterium]|nr:hypothetical protein [Clostridiales bacterium]
MQNSRTNPDEQELSSLCRRVREFAAHGDLESGKRIAVKAMGEYPHAAQPHNLLGVLLEKQGDHLSAMKHFRAAWALDPTYRPARQNLDVFGTFCPARRYAYDESDCPAERTNARLFVFGETGVGRVIKKETHR